MNKTNSKKKTKKQNLTYVAAPDSAEKSFSVCEEIKITAKHKSGFTFWSRSLVILSPLMFAATAE